MKKSPLAITILTLAVSSLTGCGKDEIKPTETQPSIQAIQPTETVVHETEEIKETVAALEISSLDDLPTTEIEIATIDEDGEMKSLTNSSDKIGEIYIKSENEEQIKNIDIMENMDNEDGTETEEHYEEEIGDSFNDLAYDYVNTPIDERNIGEINDRTSETLSAEEEEAVISDEMHDEFQNEIDEFNRKEAESLLEGSKQYLNDYYGK